jgi:hypothetical protein
MCEEGRAEIWKRRDDGDSQELAEMKEGKKEKRDQL